MGDGASYVLGAERTEPVQIDEYHFEVEKVVPYNIPRNVTQVVTKAEPLVYERYNVVKKPVQVPVELRVPYGVQYSKEKQVRVPVVTTVPYEYSVGVPVDRTVPVEMPVPVE